MSFRRPMAMFCAACAVAVSALQAQSRMTKEQYVEKYKQLALVNQETHGVPASITLAQGLLESDCGNSRLAVQANNHFGIKCKSDWTGESISHDDDALGECFRKYPSAEASYLDHCNFLDKSTRYAELFKLDPLDYKGWAYGLKKAGYATNPKYAEILIKTIEENQLYVYDKMDAGVDLAQVEDPEAAQPPVVEVVEIVKTVENVPVEKIDVDNYVVTVAGAGEYATYANNGSSFVVAKAGDTYATLAAKLKISESRLRKYNDADRGYEPVQGEAVYVKAKSTKALNGKLIHTAVEGETMRSISQVYGIRLSNLVKLNRLSPDMPVHAGMQVRLM